MTVQKQHCRMREMVNDSTETKMEDEGNGE